MQHGEPSNPGNGAAEAKEAGNRLHSPCPVVCYIDEVIHAKVCKSKGIEEEEIQQRGMERIVKKGCSIILSTNIVRN